VPPACFGGFLVLVVRKDLKMKVLVNSKNFEVTQALREFVVAQAQKLSRVSKRVQAVRVHLESNQKKNNDPMSNKVTYRVEVPGEDVIIKKRGVEMYKTIALASNTAVRHLRKKFEKRQTIKRK